MVRALAQSQARLTKHIRQVVYSYLTLDETVTKAACLSKYEREELQKSEIARADKVFILSLNRRTRPACLLTGDMLERFYKRIETRLNLAQRVALGISSDLQDYDSKLFGDELALFIQKLPARLDNAKI